MTAALVAGLLAGYGIAVPVGAVATYLVALAARTSLRIGVCAALGVATADGVYALLAVLGGVVLTGEIQLIAVPLRWLSAFVLVALAVRAGAVAIHQYRNRYRSTLTGGGSISPLRAYTNLVGITLLNPATVVYFTAVVLGSRARIVGTPVDQAVFVLAAFASSASWQLLLAGGGAMLGRVLTGMRGRLVTALASSTLILALVVHLLTHV